MHCIQDALCSLRVRDAIILWLAKSNYLEALWVYRRGVCMVNVQHVVTQDAQLTMEVPYGVASRRVGTTIAAGKVRPESGGNLTYSLLLWGREVNGRLLS